MERARPNEQIYNQETRIYDDTTTWLAEVLDGSMRTPFEYQFDGKELYGRDGTPLKKVFKDAISDADKIISHNPNLIFELRRRWVEMGEYQDMIAMCNDELPNTMIVISDFPPELMGTSDNVGGYNAERKQTMLRVITKTEDGKLKMLQQSLDLSDRTALEAIYRSLGFEPAPGELLGQRINLELALEDQELLTDKLMGVYDSSLGRRFGGEWYAGRLGQKPINTYEFVIRQQDLLAKFVGETDGRPTESQLYKLATEMDKRMGNYYEGKSYSGCGLSLGPDGFNTKNEINSLGYGNKTDEKTEYKFDKYMHCVVCQAPPKKDEPKKMCGPCGICRTCDTKLKSKMK
jgi:hypothetical protein